VEGLETSQKAAGVSCHAGADFSEAYACMDVLVRELSLDYSVTDSADPAFIYGRCANILINGRKAGVFGEIHPAVSTAFDLEHPVAAFELDLRAVQGYSGLQDNP
jgi:phenylalanyl-tRNA synthetase beta chain